MDFKKLSGIAPISSAVLLAACVGISLSEYTAPEYAIASENTADIQKSVYIDSENETESESESESESETISDREFDLEDGTYTGEGTGFAGTIKVAVTIKDKKITAIEILQTSDDAAFFNRAKAILEQMIKKQTWEVDTVSGATYSSKGIIAAVKNALTGEKDTTTAQGNTGTTTPSTSPATVGTVEEPAAYKDGTYYGTSARGFGGNVTVKVVISGGKIYSIEVPSSTETASYLANAKSVLSSMISAQSTNVDTVSGATYSSAALIEATRNALAQAATSSSSGLDNNQNNAGNNNNDNQNNGNNSDNNSGNNSAAEGKFPYNDGVYEGTAEGYNDDITVSVVIKDKTIKYIFVKSQDDDLAFFNRAVKLLDEIVEKQLVDVDTVSGATYSSKGLINAVKKALDEAARITAGNSGSQDNPDYPNNPDTPDKPQEPETKPSESETDESKNESESKTPGSNDNGNTDESESETEKNVIYEDGAYTVSVPCVPDEDEGFLEYQLNMKITIKDNQIIAIEDIQGDGDSANESYIKRAVNGRGTIKGIPEQVFAANEENPEDMIRILENSLLEEDEQDKELMKIDTVSRATCSSKSLIKACLEVLKSAATDNQE